MQVDNKLNFMQANIKDAQCIVNLHKKGIPTGFLSKQSNDFLISLYSYLIENEIVYVSKYKEKVIGFVAFSLNTKGLYKRFLKSNYPLLVKFTLKNIFSIDFLKKAFETLNAPKKTQINQASDELPELLSIVVNENYTKKGIGKELLSCLEKDLISKKVIAYKVLVGSNLESNQFYINNSFVLNHEVELHKGSKSYIYVKKLNLMYCCHV